MNRMRGRNRRWKRRRREKKFISTLHLLPLSLSLPSIHPFLSLLPSLFSSIQVSLKWVQAITSESDEVEGSQTFIITIHLIRIFLPLVLSSHLSAWFLLLPSFPIFLPLSLSFHALFSLCFHALLSLFTNFLLSQLQVFLLLSPSSTSPLVVPLEIHYSIHLTLMKNHTR